jgi:hypothetical protein
LEFKKNESFWPELKMEVLQKYHSKPVKFFFTHLAGAATGIKSFPHLEVTENFLLHLASNNMLIS